MLEERARALQRLCPFFGIRGVPGGPGATLWPVVPGWPRLGPRRAARAKQSAPRALGSGGALSLDTRGPVRPSRLGRLLGTQFPCFPQIPAPRGSRRGHSVTIEWGLLAAPSQRRLGKPSQGRGGATPGQARSLPGRGAQGALASRRYILRGCGQVGLPPGRGFTPPGVFDDVVASGTRRRHPPGMERALPPGCCSLWTLSRPSAVRSSFPGDCPAPGHRHLDLLPDSPGWHPCPTYQATS